MRNSSRVIHHPCYSAVTSQSLLARTISICKKRLASLIEDLITARKELVELVATILFAGSLFLGGAYLFLSQLAQHGW